MNNRDDKIIAMTYADGAFVELRKKADGSYQIRYPDKKHRIIYHDYQTALKVYNTLEDVILKKHASNSLPLYI